MTTRKIQLRQIISMTQKISFIEGATTIKASIWISIGSIHTIMMIRRSQNIQDISRISLLRRSGDVRS